MCGIAGLYRLGERPPAAEETAADQVLVRRMLAALAYRGPDDEGLESVGRVTFGARRLSILDVAGGHQPLSDPAGRVWAIQNGEIYNYPALHADLSARHAFRTRTDTELLPFLWQELGAELPTALEGMFALAVYDSDAETLLLARDAFGIKPLYVARVGERYLFASEIKALLCDPALPRDLDESAIARYLALGFVGGECTPFRGIRKLQPGTRAMIAPGGVRIERWSAFPKSPERVAREGEGMKGWAEETERLLARSAKSMLLSDRPLGILLSGGVDSSLIAAVLPEEIRRETRTFTIGFEDGGFHDERAWARRAAEHLGTRHREFTVALDVARELPRVVELLDEPCADPAAVPAHLVARAASSEVTVLLSGTGADELFGGYRRHRMAGMLARLGWLPRSAAAALARALGDRDQHRGTRGAERLVMVRKLLDARGRASFFESYLSALEPASPVRWAEALATRAAPARAAAGLWDELVAAWGGSPETDGEVARATDRVFYLPADLLLKEDRTTMGASVEGRVPYLDRALGAWAASLPREARYAHPHGKAVLREIARRHLPAELAERPKHGFSVPIEDWLRGPLDALAGDTFAASGSGLFDAGTLRRWHDEHRRGRDRSGPLWAALTFELWHARVARADAPALEAMGRPLERRA